ncbi:MAG: hypothetical protein NVS4B3_07530 [Gemmatimonadaceae bacterium]
MNGRTTGRSTRVLHVLNGDAVAGTFRRSVIGGDVVVWPDVLHDGPALLDDDDAAWRERRAGFLSEAFGLPYDETLRTYAMSDAVLVRSFGYDEIVLWFEHDLFDQLLLTRHLDWFARHDVDRARLSLICIGEFPGIEPFHGLGQLSAAQLASLWDTRSAITPEQNTLGQAAWRAFTAPKPDGIERLVAGDTDVLPFLRPALRRHLEEFPALANGLPRTERQILETLNDGARAPRLLFRDAQNREVAPYMGDWSFWRRVRDLAAGANPLLLIDVSEREGPGVPSSGGVRISDAGIAVLEGREDWIRLGGFDRWLGGVHLQAAPQGEVRWRWDAAAGSLRKTLGADLQSGGT